MILVHGISFRKLDHHLLIVRIVLDLVILKVSIVVCNFFEVARVRRNSRLVLGPLLEKLPNYVLIYCCSAIALILCKV